MQYNIILIVYFIILIYICNTRADPNSDENCDKIGNSTKTFQFIENYSELDCYIIKNDTLLRQLVEAFFDTGERPSQYVKITYKYSTFTNSNCTHDTMDNANCTIRQTMYIWSESVLYLLGPEPLLMLTLFAIHIPEASVNIQLPCLCEDVQFELLDRLTHLVRKHAYKYVYVYMLHA